MVKTSRFFLLVAALFALALPAFAYDSSSEKVGPLRLGLTESQVKKALGDPKSMGEWVEEAATGETVREWKYPGIGLTFSKLEGGGPPTVARFFVEAPCKYATSKGIQVGDPVEKVQKAYAREIDKEMSGPGSVVVGSVYDGLIFSLKSGKVSRIFVGAAAE